MISDKPCLAPLTSVGVTPQGELRPCCWWFANKTWHKINDMSLQEYRENILFPLYEEMKKGNYPNECKKCQVPGRSRADYYEDLYGKDREVVEQTKPLRTMDLRLGNLCNLSCITCNSYSSNYFYKLEDKGMYLFDGQADHRWKHNGSWEENPENMQQIFNNLHNIDLLYFTGGEPTINPGMRDVLKYCVDNNLNDNISLELNTNCTNANKEFIDLISNFKVRWYFSIDAVGDLNNVIRYPGKYEQLMKNIQTILKTNKKGDVFVFTPTISIFNFFKLDKYIAEINKFIADNKTPELKFKLAEAVNVLMIPQWMNLGNLPEGMFESYINNIPEPWRGNIEDKFKKSIKFEKDNTHSWEEILDKTRKYFSARGYDAKLTGIPGI